MCATRVRAVLGMKEALRAETKRKQRDVGEGTCDASTCGARGESGANFRGDGGGVGVIRKFEAPLRAITQREHENPGGISAPTSDSGFARHRHDFDECERRGILVDLAHASHRTVEEMLGRATRPLVSSHGGVQATCAVNRNLTDDEIRGVAEATTRHGKLIGLAARPSGRNRKSTR